MFQLQPNHSVKLEIPKLVEGVWYIVFEVVILWLQSIITGSHWKKKLFGTHNLSEDWNSNLNFMWVPWQIWEQPTAYFWIQTGFKSGLFFYVGPRLLLLLGPLILSLLPVFSLFEDFSRRFSTSLKTVGQTLKSLTDSEISKLKTEILKSEGVLNLVSSNESHLLDLPLAEKLDDLNRVAAVVSRLEKKCSELALQGFQHNQHEEGWGLREKKKKREMGEGDELWGLGMYV